MKDPLDALREAGCPVELLSEAQRRVLAALTEQETELLVAVQQRLHEAEGEVTGHDWKML